MIKKSMQPVRMWVSPSFKRNLKAQASAEGFKLIDYTELLSEDIKNKGGLFEKSNKKKFDFRF